MEKTKKEGKEDEALANKNFWLRHWGRLTHCKEATVIKTGSRRQ